MKINNLIVSLVLACTWVQSSPAHAGKKDFFKLCKKIQSRIWNRNVEASPTYVRAVEMPASDDCPICFDNMSGLLKAKFICNHEICYECAGKMNTNTGTIDCPLCRRISIIKPQETEEPVEIADDNSVSEIDPPVMFADNYSISEMDSAQEITNRLRDDLAQQVIMSTIEVKIPSGETIRVQINPAVTRVYELKQLIQDLVGISFHNHSLFNGHSHMEDDRKLSDYGVREGSSVHVIMRLRGN